MGKTIQDNRYENIGPTAWRVAYFRAQTDIKYATDIFHELDSVTKPDSPAVAEYMESARTSQLAPQFEARYKLINQLLNKYKTDQIVELAAGLTPRGLEMTDEDHCLKYAELDLPSMVKDTVPISSYFETGTLLGGDSLTTALYWSGHASRQVPHLTHFS